jgi:hypothetical protein
MMDTARSLRDQARRWRTLAGQDCHGTADALLEAACALEQRATHLERTSIATALSADADPVPGASAPADTLFSRAWRLAGRRTGRA